MLKRLLKGEGVCSRMVISPTVQASASGTKGSLKSIAEVVEGLLERVELKKKWAGAARPTTRTALEPDGPNHLGL